MTRVADARAYDHAFDWVRRNVESGALPTAVLGIATSDGVVALDAFGGASVDDAYPLFSITKPIVGLAALTLLEEGRLTPTTPVTAALPSFGEGRGDVVQLRHLVSHTSGIVEPPMDRPGLRASFLAPGRDFAAGTASRYSTIAFEGVAALIEHASGEPWERRVAEVARRADAPGLAFDADVSPHAPVDAAARGLDWEAFRTLRHPGAGMSGRAADLLAIGSALLRDDGTVLSRAAAAAMLRPLTGDIPRLEPYTADRGQDWGFAWNLRSRAPGLLTRDTYGHGGWAGTEFWITPSLDVCFVLLSNIADGFGRFGADADQLHNAVAAGASA